MNRARADAADGGGVDVCRSAGSERNQPVIADIHRDNGDPERGVGDPRRNFAIFTRCGAPRLDDLDYVQ